MMYVMNLIYQKMFFKIKKKVKLFDDLVGYFYG